MNNNIKEYTKEINENKILDSYKNLEVTSENFKELHENIMYFHTTEAEVVKCSGIYAQNNSATVTRWSLIRLDGATMYISGKYKVKETFKLDLRTQSRVVGTQFHLHANVEGKDSESSIILEYDPDADFVSFELRGTAFHTHINYLDRVIPPSETVYNINNSQCETICSQIVAYNDTSTIIRWSLINQLGTIVHTSDKYIEWETWIFNLDDLSLVSDTQLTLRAYVEGDDSYSDTIICYRANSNTAYFKLDGKILDTKLKYNGYVSSASSPPVYPCSTITAYNDSRMFTKWALYTLDGDLIYRSGRHRINTDFYLDLVTTGVDIGTRMILKAECIAGSDSVGYIILERSIEDYLFVDFLLRGDAFRTVLMCDYIN